VLAVRPADTAVTPELRKLSAELAVVDARHDTCARVVSLGLDLQAGLHLAADTPDFESAARCARVQRKLFPDGLSIVNANTRAESGNAARLEKLLLDDAEVKTVLKSIPLSGKRTLLDIANRWIAAGAELGGLEDQRAAALAQAQGASPTKATIQGARSAWMRVVSQVLGGLEMSDAPSATIEELRHAAVETSDRAARRYTQGQVAEPKENAGSHEGG
jgi:hypothetical protein